LGTLSLATFFSIFKLRFKIFKNWFFYDDNRKAVIFSAVLLLIVLAFIYNNFSNEKIIFFINIFIPVFTTNSFLKITLKENRFLLNFFNKKKLLQTKRIQAVAINLLIFTILLFVQLGFMSNRNNSLFLILTEIFLLIIIGSLHPIFVREKKYKSTGTKRNNLWNYKIFNKNLLPIRSIVNREILFLFRTNKKFLIKYIFNTLLGNFFLILFIINNNKEEFFVWVLPLQFIFLLATILNSPTSNNIAIAKTFPCSLTSILKGEFVFWSVLFLLHLFFILVLYSFFIPTIDLFLSTIIFFIALFLLAYTLLLRLTYADNIPTRILLFYMFIIPVTIPYTIYNCSKKIRC
jgi:hypothetical protein